MSRDLYQIDILNIIFKEREREKKHNNNESAYDCDNPN